MEDTRILVAMENDISINNVKTILNENGLDVIAEVKDGDNCINEIRNIKPDLAILDYQLPKLNGFEVAKIVGKEKICDIIVISNNKNLFPSDSLPVDLVAVTSPIKSDSFISTVNLLLKNRKKIKKLEKEIETLKNTLDARKHIEKAKGLLIKNLDITEEQAFKRIQKQSMDRGISMKEIAKAIILTYD